MLSPRLLWTAAYFPQPVSTVHRWAPTAANHVSTMGTTSNGTQSSHVPNSIAVILNTRSTVAAYPYCLEKIWNYPDSKVREWACATINTVITLDPNPDLISGSATFSVPIVRNTASASVGNGGLDSNAGGNQIDGNTLVDGGSILVTNSGSG